MLADRKIKVAIVGGGCAGITAAFELTRPEHRGRYEVTVYQTGWRLGGKGASGRGPAGRIEEHGLHVWLGFYENAFRLMRECYAELDRDPRLCPIATWRDAFLEEPHIGIAGPSAQGGWTSWTAHFPVGEGLPGDPLAANNPFAMSSYLARMVALLRTVLFGLAARRGGVDGGPSPPGLHAEAGAPPQGPVEQLMRKLGELLAIGVLKSVAGVISALSILELMLRSLPAGLETAVSRQLEAVVACARDQLERIVCADDDMRLKWELIDLLLAMLLGAARFGLLVDPRGLAALDDYECRDWLRMNGASPRALDSAFMRGLYDLTFAYEDGDPARPRRAASQWLRCFLRMFFTYRGAVYWKMRSGMGDIVFAPYYEVLKRRGVRFEFFHRLENVRLAPPHRLSPGEKPYVEALEFDVQARIADGGEYRPLVDVKGVPCWPSAPDHAQLLDGERLRGEGRAFESFWDRRKEGTRTLQVARDFDFVVLGVGIGAIPHVCAEILARDARWRDMVAHVKTVATQAFQLWMSEDMPALGWKAGPITHAAFVKPFDTWSDMGHVAAEEAWRREPRSIAYFCNVLPDPTHGPDERRPDYPALRQDEVRRNAVQFLDRHIRHLWPGAVDAAGRFRWELLVDPAEQDGGAAAPGPRDERRFDSQYWTANVNPSDRYALVLPGSLKHRISPLDTTYDNLVVAGDWTACGFTDGCIEAAVMSGRLAAHAVSGLPKLEEIVGYDHP